MKVILAILLHRLASRINNTDHEELIEVRDEYDICRWRVVFTTAEASHCIRVDPAQLPDGWELVEQHDVCRSHTNRHQYRSHY